MKGGLTAKQKYRIAGGIALVVFASFGISWCVHMNEMSMMKKPRSSEAKVGLGGIFTCAIAFYADHKAGQETFEISDINQLGYSPSGTPRYTFWYSVKGVPTRFNVVSPDLARSCDGPPTIVKVAASATGFTAAARGNIDNDATCDEWSISDNRKLVNTLNDMTQ